MVPSLRIALVGFGRVEHAAFEAFFRVGGKRCPAYAQEPDFRRADFVIVDAADEAARAAVRAEGVTDRAVVLGSPALPGALLQLARPLNLMQVVRALDAVMAERQPAAADTTREGLVVVEPGSDVAAGPDTVSDRLDDDPPSVFLGCEPQTLDEVLHEVPDDAGAAQGGSAAAPGTSAVLPFLERRRRPRGAPMDHILVVDDSDIALRFMATHLQRFGFQIHLAKSGEEALKRVTERRFEFVFLDVRMDGMDGFQVCKAIKRADHPAGQAPPTVVMLTCLASPVDRLRGTMAGADAYLTKPLREVELLKIVGEREVARHAYAETAAASTRR